MLAGGYARAGAWLAVLILALLLAPQALLAQSGRVVTEPEPADPRAAPAPRRPPSPTVNVPPPAAPSPRQPGKVVTEPEPAGPGQGNPPSAAPPWAPPPMGPQPQPAPQPPARPTPANDPSPRPDINPPSSEACRRFPNLC